VFSEELFRAKLWKGFAVSDLSSPMLPFWRPLIIISIRIIDGIEGFRNYKMPMYE
jgi:hypothetical protein